MHSGRGLEAFFTAKNRKKTAAQHPQNASQAPPRRRVVCTRAQGLFAHATTPGAPTIVVAQAKAARYKNICASGPENVCALLAASSTKPACRYLYPMPPSQPAQLEAINLFIESGRLSDAKPATNGDFNPQKFSGGQAPGKPLQQRAEAGHCWARCRSPRLAGAKD